LLSFRLAPLLVMGRLFGFWFLFNAILPTGYISRDSNPESHCHVYSSTLFSRPFFR